MGTFLGGTFLNETFLLRLAIGGLIEPLFLSFQMLDDGSLICFGNPLGKDPFWIDVSQTIRQPMTRQVMPLFRMNLLINIKDITDSQGILVNELVATSASRPS